MKRLILTLLAITTSLGIACVTRASAPTMTQRERAIIADSLQRLVAAAYDFRQPGVVERLMSLYPDSGRVISASVGRVSASRDTLQRSITRFWENVGTNMREPRWTWGDIFVDVLAADAAVMTATYSVPHLTPEGTSHLIGGALTAVFARRNGRWVILHEHLSDATSGQ
jgi:ketosteroid isomerase-like protein